MLTWLSVRDLAVVRSLEFEPTPGLNIVTGQTGAGKSILVTALQLALGARARADLVRTGCERAEVQAAFDLDLAPTLRERAESLLDDPVEEVIIRRVIAASGRSRAWINGVLVPTHKLAWLVRGILDICSQHEHDQLADPASHLTFLDAYATLDADRARMHREWEGFRQASDTLSSLRSRIRDRVEREAILRLQLDDIDAVDPQPGEEDELAQELNRLSHADRLRALSAHTEELLYSGTDSVSARLARTRREIESLAGVDADLDALGARLDEALTSLEELGRDLGTYGRRIHHDPERLAEVEERLTALRRLTRRFGGSPERLLSHRDALRAELQDLASLEHGLEEAEAAVQATLAVAATTARALSQARQAAARALGEAITVELHDLGMGDARVEVDVARRQGSEEHPEVDGARLGPQGIDRVELMIAPNRGEPPRPLHRIASGGELSRSLLAIKRVLAARAPRGLYVFDEVDTGVGGAVAEAIGRKLAAIAAHQQVICITHQPQIAAYGDTHWWVSKHTEGDRTSSTLRALSPQEREGELARMLGGIDVTEASHQAARDLLRAAAAARA